MTYWKTVFYLCDIPDGDMAYMLEVEKHLLKSREVIILWLIKCNDIQALVQSIGLGSLHVFGRK